MGNPAVVFTTYGTDATTNVAGGGSFTEIKSDLAPQSGLHANGDYTITDFDTFSIFRNSVKVW